MKVVIRKKSPYQCEYQIIRKDNSVDFISLETTTYLLHDICHFVVENQLSYSKGFWGLLASGHNFTSLVGKENPDTEELRFIEKIVGPVQSVHWGHIPQENFAVHIQHLQFNLPASTLTTCLSEIKLLTEQWRQLTVGEQLMLVWPLN